jgi:hypothetical protein
MLIVGDGVRTVGAACTEATSRPLSCMQTPALADLVVRYLLIGERALRASFAAPAALGRHSSRHVGVRTVGTGTPWRADPDCTVEHRSGPVGRH